MNRAGDRIDLAELASIQLGDGALSFVYADNDSTLVMRLLLSAMAHGIDLPKLVTITTSENSYALAYPRHIVLEGG